MMIFGGPVGEHLLPTFCDADQFRRHPQLRRWIIIVDGVPMWERRQD